LSLKGELKRRGFFYLVGYFDFDDAGDLAILSLKIGTFWSGYKDVSTTSE